MRREITLVLLARPPRGLVLLAVRQAWAHAVFTPPKPLPAQDIAVTGQQLVPLAGALALAALACLAAVIATRSALRRGAGVPAGGARRGHGGRRPGWPAGPGGACRRAGRRALRPAGRLDDGRHVLRPRGAPIVIAGPGQAIAAGAPWRAAAAAGAVVIVLAGLATAWRGPRWPVMSARFEVALLPPALPPAATTPMRRPMWESLSRDVDRSR